MSPRAERITAQRSWQPRYLAYAAAHGMTPERMMDADAAQWPGGSNVGFMQWIQWAWNTWDVLHKYGANHVRSDEEHMEFTVWLADAMGVAL